MASDQGDVVMSTELRTENGITSKTDSQESSPAVSTVKTEAKNLDVPESETSAKLQEEPRLGNSLSALVVDYASCDSDVDDLVLEPPNQPGISVQSIDISVNPEKFETSFVNLKKLETSSVILEKLEPSVNLDKLETSSVNLEKLKTSVNLEKLEFSVNLDKLETSSVNLEKLETSYVSLERLETSSVNLENLKDYRDKQVVQSEDSESDSESSTATSSGASSDSDSDSDSSDSDSSDSHSVNSNDLKDSDDKKRSPRTKKTKGELDDLPPIEELKISVPEVLCEPLGEVGWMVEQLVVVKPIAGKPTLNLETVLFVERGRRVLGKVFDVFGQVSDPHYCVRFNSAEHIKESAIVVGMPVYFAPNSPHTTLVFLHELVKLKGSDAPGEDEPPEFSDDEEEQAYNQIQRQKQRQKNEKNQSQGGNEGMVKRKRLGWQSNNNPWNNNWGPRGHSTPPGMSPRGWSPANGPRNFSESFNYQHPWCPPTPPTTFPGISTSYGPQNTFDPSQNPGNHFQPLSGQFGSQNTNNLCQNTTNPFRPMHYQFDQSSLTYQQNNLPPRGPRYPFSQQPRFRPSFGSFQQYRPDSYPPPPTGNNPGNMWAPSQPPMGICWSVPPPPPSPNT